MNDLFSNTHKIVKANKDLAIHTLIIVSILSIVTFGYRYFNDFFLYESLDGVNFYHFEQNYKWQSGRFGIFPLVLLRGQIAHPLLIGVLYIVFTSISLITLFKLFDVTNKLKQILLSALIVTLPVWIYSHALLIHDVDLFACGFLFAVLSVYFINKSKFSIFTSIIFLVMSLSCYQAYFSVYLTLSILLVSYKILDNQIFRDNIIFLFKIFLVGFASLAVYYVLLKCALLIHAPEELAYNTPINATDFLNIGQTINLFIKLYMYYLGYFLAPLTYFRHAYILIMLLLYLFTCYIAVRLILQDRIEFKNIVLIAFLLLLIPFFCNITVFIAKGFTNYTLQTSNELTIMFCLCLSGKILLNNNSSRVYSLFTSFAVVFFAISNAIYANQLFLMLGIQNLQNCAVFTRILSAIEEIPNYEVGKTPIAFVGTLHKNPALNNRKSFDHLKRDIDWRLSPPFSSLSSHPFRFKVLFSHFMGYPINELQLKHEPEFLKTTPIFPYPGYCISNEGVIYVKLSE